MKKYFISGAILAGLAVAIGAYGAHGGAKFMDAETILTFGKAVRYQMNHAFALIAVAFAISQWPDQFRLLNLAGYSFLGGIIAFSGSLYLIVFANLPMGYITPFGGILFVIGWLILAYAVFKTKE
jgi:uncharacterized membrane protein YgdD (TMEM256/DUF423 family)